MAQEQHQLIRKAVDGVELWYAGKRAHELTRDEAVKCAAHFHRAHLESWYWAAMADRRMRKMEEALSSEQIKRLDRWLQDHLNDAYKGDGTERWQPWQSYR